jgi:hypothetical protein
MIREQAKKKMMLANTIDAYTEILNGAVSQISISL